MDEIEKELPFQIHALEQKGFVQIDEILTEENGSDCYSALHIYRKNKK